jgi:hypothetical protein
VENDADGDQLDFIRLQRRQLRAQDVLVDPVRPRDLYAFFVTRRSSIDYGYLGEGEHGHNGDKIDSGKPRGEAIETDFAAIEHAAHALQRRLAGRFWRS